MERDLELAVLNSPAEPPQNYDTVLRQTSSNAHFISIWRNSPQWARTSSFARFLDHTQGLQKGGKKVIEYKVCVLIYPEIFV